MKSRKRPADLKVSVRDIAKAAGFLKSAAAYALQNHPRIGKATRDRVQRIAERLGYAPDARMTAWMAKVRDAKNKSLLPIAWLNTNSEEDAWRKYPFLSPYLDGARERALQLGYRIDEIWTRQPGMSAKRSGEILFQRGITGSIITHFRQHYRLPWEHMACVALERGLLAPALHRVITDHFFNFTLALKMLRRAGYRRIGVCLARSMDRRFHGAFENKMYNYNSTITKAKPVPPLFYDMKKPERVEKVEKQTTAWLRRHKPEVVVTHNNLMVTWAGEAGLRVPEEIGVVHLATDDDVSDWAGIHSRRREIGAAAAEMVVSLMHNRQFGVPRTAMNMMIHGIWHAGWTLLVPKPTQPAYTRFCWTSSTVRLDLRES